MNQRYELTPLKERHRAIWAAGAYSRIARGIQSVADHVVRSARIRPGDRVLDIACGTGNTALMARARGARVTGLDLTPELLRIAEKREASAGYDDILWVEGDAEALPFPDASFDVVVSSCGLMFAPDQAKAAAEASRVVRPGGRIAIQAWTPNGGVARMFAVTGAYAPPPPALPSPFRWGDESQVRTLLGSTFFNFQFERSDCPEFADTPEQIADLYIDAYGPTNRVYHSLPAERAESLRQDLIHLYSGYITPLDRKVRWGREYLLSSATRLG